MCVLLVNISMFVTVVNVFLFVELNFILEIYANDEWPVDWSDLTPSEMPPVLYINESDTIDTLLIEDLSTTIGHTTETQSQEESFAKILNTTEILNQEESSTKLLHTTKVQSQEESFGKILNNAATTPLCAMTPGKLVITGYEVKFSEILKTDGTFGIHCKNSTNVSVVYIFAIQKVVIDQNVQAPGVDLFILAPTWQVVTVCSINLKGVEGVYMPMPQPRKIGSDGEDGHPGNPGFPGGNFFGMGETFIDGKYLTIDVSGGDGGPGQDGGVGGDGTVGRHALKSNLSLTCTHSACDNTGTMKVTALDNQGEYTDFRCKEEYNYIIYDMFFLPPVSGNVRECSYYIYGSEGTIAGAGGDGGVGGIGGYPGLIVLVELFELSGILQVNSSGKTGRGGRGNQGGIWSYTGWDVSFKKRETYSNQSPRVSGTSTVKYIDSKTFSKLGQTLGVDGVNSLNITDPIHGEPLNLPKINSLMVEYNKFLTSHNKTP